MNYLFSNAVAWFLSGLFAYITNRKYVFNSSSAEIFKEALSFFSSRLVTGLLDMFFMCFFVNFNLYDVLFKIVVNVIVVILNYILSKLIVFKNK